MSQILLTCNWKIKHHNIYNAYDVKPRVSILCRFHMVLTLYSFLPLYKEKVVCNWLCKTRFYSACTVLYFQIHKTLYQNIEFCYSIKLSTTLLCFFPYLFTIIIWEEFWGRKFCGFNENLNFKDEICALLSIVNCVEHDIANMNIFTHYIFRLCS